MPLCNKQSIKLTIDDGLEIEVQAGKAPIINDITETKMRVGCGSATIGMFASQWINLVDEVVVVDDHITGVVSEHQAGKVFNWRTKKNAPVSRSDFVLETAIPAQTCRKSTVSRWQLQQH